MDKKLIKQILQYVEEMEEIVDYDRGSARDFKELLEENPERVPDFYFTLKEMLNA